MTIWHDVLVGYLSVGCALTTMAFTAPGRERPSLWMLPLGMLAWPLVLLMGERRR